MKKLQNNFTSPEQSKRLLELGVPADSADCYRKFHDECGFSRVCERWYDHELHKNFFTHIRDVVPCWSVGRLINILFICCDECYMRVDKHYALISLADYAMATFELCVKNRTIDFSKLED